MMLIAVSDFFGETVCLSVWLVLLFLVCWCHMLTKYTWR